jgi:membrane protein involved in colicin uptake
MMAGKSQFAMQNIGEGGLQGLNAYQEAQRMDDAARKALMQSEMQMTAAQRAERQGARKDAVTLTHEAERSQQMAMQLAGQSEQIKNTKAYQDTMGKAALMTAGAAQSRANALNAAAGTKGAFTEAQVAAARDKAYDNITNDKAYLYNQMKAAQAAKDAGKPFDPAAYKKALIDAETERLLGGTSRATMPSEAPTGGKLGGGTFNSSLWGQPQVVTPK